MNKIVNFLPICVVLLMLLYSCQKSSTENKTKTTIENLTSESVVTNIEMGGTSKESAEISTTVPVSIFGEDLGAVADVNYIYYYKNGIYRESKKTHEKVCIVSPQKFNNNEFRYLHINNEYLYYTVISKNSFAVTTIYQVRTDGKENKKYFSNLEFEKLDINPNSGALNIVMIKNSNMLLEMSNELYLYDSQTKELSCVAYGADEYKVKNNKLYYADKYSINELNLSTFQSRSLLEEDMGYADNSAPISQLNTYYYFGFLKKELYYSQRNPRGLYLFKDGGGEDILIDGSPSVRELNFIEYNDSLYYTSESLENKKSIFKRYDPTIKQVFEIPTPDDFWLALSIQNGEVQYAKSGTENGSFQLIP